MLKNDADVTAGQEGLVNRAQTFRKLVVLSTAVSLALSILGTGAAIAADSRILYVGTGPLPAGNGVLTPSTVTQGGTTRIDITVLSGDNQSIAHTNLFFPKVGTTLAPGLTVSYVFGPNASSCSPTGAVTTGATSVQCDFGSLAAGGSRTVSILVDVAAGFSATGELFTANVETNNENGSNSQVFAATSGAFAVDPSTNDDLGTYAKPGHATRRPFGTTGARGSPTS